MSDSDADSKASRLEPEVRDMKLEPDTPAEDGDADVVKQSVEEDGKGRVAVTPNGHAASPGQAAASRTQTPIKSERSSGSPGQASEREEILGGDITVKMEPGKGPKLARSTSQKVVSRPPPLYLDHENKTEEAKETFDVIESCTYGNKSMGQTEHALECDCAEEWGMSSTPSLSLELASLTVICRCREQEESCLRRGFRLHQSRN